MSKSLDQGYQVLKETATLNSTVRVEELDIPFGEARTLLAVVREAIGWLQGIEFILDTGRQPAEEEEKEG